MKQLRYNVIRAGLEALYFSGAHHLLRPLLSGVGAIFMLHHVRPAREAAFQPNRHLEVTPEFLRATLCHLRSRDIDIVSMDELHERLVQGRFDRLHDWLRALPGEHDLAREIEALCTTHDVDMAALCRSLCLSWAEVKTFAADPLVTIGAHSVSHCNLAKLAEDIAAQELATSRARIEQALERPVLHLAYPYGDREAAGMREFGLAATAGFKTAVTTRPGMLFPDNAGQMTALPRVSLNGNYQDPRILPVLTSGAATAMWNGFRRIAAA